MPYTGSFGLQGGGMHTINSDVFTLPYPGDLEVYYPHQYGSGSTAYDESGAGYDGSITGAIWGSYLFGGGLDFDGTDDLVATGASYDSLIGAGGECTINVWVNSDGYSGFSWPTIFGTRNSGNNMQICLRSDTNEIALLYTDGGTGNRLTPGNIIGGDGNDHVLTATVSESNGAVRFYLDGSEVANDTAFSSFAATTDEIGIGGDPKNLDRYHDGREAEAALWSRAFTASEVSALYDKYTTA